jgi:hypothetical protein
LKGRRLKLEIRSQNELWNDSQKITTKEGEILHPVFQFYYFPKTYNWDE